MRYGQPSSSARDLSRRSFLRVTGYGSAGLLAGNFLPFSAFGQTLDASQLARLDFEVSYRTQISNLPRDAEEVHVWMPLPPVSVAQEIKDLSVSCPLPYEITRDELYHNRMVHVVSGPRPFILEARYHVTRRRMGTHQAELDSRSARKYLTLTPRVRVTDEVAAFVDGAVGQAEQPLEVGRRIFDAIVELLSYDKTIPGCGTGDTAWIMRHKRGKCDDYHALFMAAMISRQIPVRWEQGFPLALPTGKDPASMRLSGDCSGAHCWVSFYDPSQGWVPCDVSEADKTGEGGAFYFGQLSPNRFQVSEGRRIVLNPAQGGDPLSTFAFAYAEADGIPLIYGANYENVIRYTITDSESS